MKFAPFNKCQRLIVPKTDFSVTVSILLQSATRQFFINADVAAFVCINVAVVFHFFLQLPESDHPPVGRG